MTWGKNTWFASGFQFYEGWRCLIRASLQWTYVVGLERTGEVACGRPERNRREDLLRTPDAGHLDLLWHGSDLPRWNLPVSFSMLLIIRGVVFESVVWDFVV